MKRRVDLWRSTTNEVKRVLSEAGRYRLKVTRVTVTSSTVLSVQSKRIRASICRDTQRGEIHLSDAAMLRV